MMKKKEEDKEEVLRQDRLNKRDRLTFQFRSLTNNVERNKCLQIKCLLNNVLQ